ncbi:MULTISPECIES: hypothetical protein [unclassified Clostridium]|uniref:hypothetical protein n=1 Tax=unclassified Clostridium TaxID=2614128 RepID=UPI0025B9BB6F|nr:MULTISPECIES: hypothetical protein [unclassified Clostridium]
MNSKNKDTLGSRNLTTQDKLSDIFKVVTVQEINNTKLQRYLNNFFTSKGLSQNTVACLFDGTQNPEVLGKIERIAFAQGCYDILKWKDLKPELYFSPAELNEFDTFIVSDENENINKIFMKNVKKINDFTYQCYSTAKELYLYRKNSLVTYNKNTQRASKYKTIGTNNLKVREASVNYDAVKNIEAAILEKKFFTNEIYFNVLIMEGKEPKFKYKKNFDNIGDLTIEPFYDRSSNRLTYCNIIDGYHRFLAMTNAYIKHKEETGEDLEIGLCVMVTLFNEDQAKRFIAQQFKRSDTDEEYLRSLESSDFDEFATKLAQKINVLDKNLSATYDEMKFEEKLTYRTLLGDAIELTDIEVNQFQERVYTTEKMAVIINATIECLMANKEFKTIKDVRKNSYFLDANMFVGYIAIANILKNYDYEKYIIPLVESLCNLNEKEVSQLKLNNKDCSVKKIYDYFENIAKEVVK